MLSCTAPNKPFSGFWLLCCLACGGVEMSKKQGKLIEVDWKLVQIARLLKNLGPGESQMTEEQRERIKERIVKEEQKP